MINEITTPIRRVKDRHVIAGRLAAIQEARVDVVHPMSALAWADGCGEANLNLTEPYLTPTGVVASLSGAASPTALRHVAARLDVPMPYLTRLNGSGNGDLAAYNINTLSGRNDKTVMSRWLMCEDGAYLRAVLSDRYGAIDNVDLVAAVITGLKSAGVGLGDCEVDADITDDRFRLRIAVPAIQQAAPDLLVGYRPPITPARRLHDQTGGEDLPVLWAGLEISNSETGKGAVQLLPRAVVQVCRNGMTKTADMLRQIHVAGRLQEGVIDWSESTKRKSLELTTSQVEDAARAFCSVSYLDKLIAEMRQAKGATVESPTTAVKIVAERIGLSEAEGKRVLDLFAASGDTTMFGLAQAVTVAAQYAPDGDRQAEMEAEFWSVLNLGPVITA
jgi:hypothetical protein